MFNFHKTNSLIRTTFINIKQVENKQYYVVKRIKNILNKTLIVPTKINYRGKNE